MEGLEPKTLVYLLVESSELFLSDVDPALVQSFLNRGLVDFSQHILLGGSWVELLIDGRV